MLATLAENLDADLLDMEAVRQAAALHAQSQSLEKSRQAYIFYQSLGDEIGPGCCQARHCHHLTIAHSHYCKLHYFVKLKGSEALIRLKEY